MIIVNPVTCDLTNIDRHLSTANPGEEVHLPAGAYATRGAWGYPGYRMIHGRLVGAGSETAVYLDDPTDTIPTDKGDVAAAYYEMLTGGHKVVLNRGIRVEDMRLVATASKPVKAIHIWGAESVVSGVTVDGIWGDAKILEGEGFGIIVNAGGDPTLQGGNVIENCTVNARRGSYFCGIYLGIESPFPQVINRVSRCVVRATANNDIPPTGVGFGVNSDIVIEDCQTMNVSRPIFSDTGGGNDVVVRRLRANGCGTAIEFQGKSSRDSRRRILIEDCDFIHGDTGAGFVAGLVLAHIKDPALAGTPPPRMDDIVVRNCRFYNESGTPGHIGSSQIAPNGRQPRFQGCTFIGDWNGDQARDAKWTFEGCEFRK